MKTVVGIAGLMASRVGTPLLDELRQLHPGISASKLDYNSGPLDVHDPRVAELQARLTAAGLEPAAARTQIDPSKEYLFGMDRVYDEADLAAAELIEMRLSDEDGLRVESGRRDPLGRIELNVGRLRKLPHSRYGCASTGFIVAERIRSELAGRDLKGVAFKPTIPSRFPEGVGDNPHRTEWSPSLGETWWELTSEYWMPLLAMTVDVCHRDTYVSLTEIERKAWKWRHGVRLREGRFKRPELHYTRKSLELWFGRGWDVARLREPLNSFVDDDRRHLVVSQKFYQAFRELGIHAEWVPVRIDEE